MLTIKLTKCVPGEVFEDLDLTNRLLARTGEIVSTNNTRDKHLDGTHSAAAAGGGGPPRIQILSSSSSSAVETSLPDHDADEQHPFDEALEYDFQLPQSMPDPLASTMPSKGSKYGFNSQYSGHFLHIQNPDILTVEDPEEKSSGERWREMRVKEEAKFDREWYLADQYEPPEELVEILGFEIPEEEMLAPLGEEEQALLRSIGNRECIPPKPGSFFVFVFVCVSVCLWLRACLCVFGLCVGMVVNGSSNRQSKRYISQSPAINLRHPLRQNNNPQLPNPRIRMDNLPSLANTLIPLARVPPRVSRVSRVPPVHIHIHPPVSHPPPPPFTPTQTLPPQKTPILPSVPLAPAVPKTLRPHSAVYLL